MKDIVFLMQGLENFCNHRDPMELDFTKGSLTLITGPNGIGKTSMLQAIPFTLYGQCEKGRGDDVLNNKTGKNCHTWTIFLVNGIKYRVDRYVKYTKIGNSATITRGDDNEPYLKGHSEVLPEIEKLLMPYKLFINTLLFAQKVKTFFTDLSDSDQKEIFRKIMNLDDFVLYMKQCGIELKEIEEIILKLNQDLYSNQGSLDHTKEQRKEFIRKEIFFQEEKTKKLCDLSEKTATENQKILNHLEQQKGLPKDTTLRRQEITNEISVLEHTLSNLTSVNDSKINNCDNQAKLKISQLETKSLELSNESSKEMAENIESAKGALKIEEDSIKKQKDSIAIEIQKINVSIAQEKSAIDFIIRENEKLTLDSELTMCPTCKRDMNDDCINQLNSLIDENKKLIQFRNHAIKDYQIIISDLQDKLTILNNTSKTNIDDYNETIKAFQKLNRETIAQYIERKNIAINKVKSLMKGTVDKIKSENIKERENIQLNIMNLTTELGVLNVTQETIDRFNKTLTLLQQTKDNLIKEYNDTETFKFDTSLIKNCDIQIENYRKIKTELETKRDSYHEKIKIIKFWKLGFSGSGIQSMLIDEAIPFMNERISYYMNLLCNGRYTVTFDTLKATKDAKEFRDKISVNVFDNQTHSDKRVKFSGGQTRLVDIGAILTLADLQAKVQDAKVNIILFDEIFDALDDENIRFAANLLRLASETKWVGIVSHRHIEHIEADVVLEIR